MTHDASRNRTCCIPTARTHAHHDACERVCPERALAAQRTRTHTPPRAPLPSRTSPSLHHNITTTTSSQHPHTQSPPGLVHPPRPPPCTPPRSAKVIIVDISPPAALPPPNTIFPDINSAWRALPAKTKTAHVITSTAADDTELRRKNVAYQQGKVDAGEREEMCASMCIREISAALFKALGLHSHVDKLSSRGLTECRAFYLDWLKHHTAILTTHFSALHASRSQVATSALPGAHALTLFQAVARTSTSANLHVHNPSLKQVAWTLTFMANNPARFLHISARNLSLLVQYLLNGIDIANMTTAIATTTPSAAWTRPGRWAAAVEGAINAGGASGAWATMRDTCDDKVTPAWQRREFQRYIAFLRREGMAVEFGEFEVVGNERDGLEREVEELKEQVAEMVWRQGVLEERHETERMQHAEEKKQMEGRISELEGTVAHLTKTVADFQNLICTHLPPAAAALL
ncbi:hypothetical protein DFH27DRAFT_529588 [Peziza echinospora]|nr:hypothetical protein DFH27DRAFT_529588 [Peziza echinospora]